MKVYGYLRVSTDKQSDSLASQESLVEDYFERMKKLGDLPEDTTFSGCFADEDKSGSTPLFERPAGYEMLKVIRPGDHIIVAKHDRAFRCMMDACTTIKQLQTQDVELHMINLGVSPSNPIGKFVFHIMSAFAELEVEFIRARIKDALAHRKRTGRPVNQSTPLGYKRQKVEGEVRFVPNRDEVAMCYEIRDLRDAGLSWPECATTIAKEHGWKCPSTGTDWSVRLAKRAYQATLDNFPRYDGRTLDDFSENHRQRQHDIAMSDRVDV